MLQVNKKNTAGNRISIDESLILKA